MNADDPHAHLTALDSSAHPAEWAQLALSLAEELAAPATATQATGLLRATEFLLLRQPGAAPRARFHRAAYLAWSQSHEPDRETCLRRAIHHAVTASDWIHAGALASEPPAAAAETLASLLNGAAACTVRLSAPGAEDWQRAAKACRVAQAALAAHDASPGAAGELCGALHANLAMAEAALSGAPHTPPEAETAARHAHAIQTAREAGGPAGAIPELWRMLHWAWSLPEEPNPHLAMAYTELARAYAGMGHVRESVPYVYCAIAMATSAREPSAEWRQILDGAHGVLESILAALGHAHRAMELSAGARGGFASAREAWQLGNQLLTANPQQALLAYDQALSLFPLWPAGMYSRGLARLLLNQPREAVEDFTASLSFLPNHPRTLLARSKAYTMAGDPALAAADLELARSLDPTLSAARPAGA
ncbi:MAG: hypothetical protein IT164_08690 [Bryobacterales bacterium]|nr:hypothetical protein [Bryobacterales bacterium]